MGVIGLADMLLSTEGVPTSLISLLETIHDSGRALLNLINNMLDLSRIDANMLTIAPRVRQPHRKPAVHSIRAR